MYYRDKLTKLQKEYIFERFLKVVKGTARHGYMQRDAEVETFLRNYAKRRIAQLRRNATYLRCGEWLIHLQQSKMSHRAALAELKLSIDFMEHVRGWVYTHRYECAKDTYELLKMEYDVQRMSEKRIAKELFLLRV